MWLVWHWVAPRTLRLHRWNQRDIGDPHTLSEDLWGGGDRGGRGRMPGHGRTATAVKVAISFGEISIDKQRERKQTELVY